MSGMDQDWEQEDRRICCGCVSEAFLSGLIAQRDIAMCSYCGSSAPSVAIEELADEVETAFNAHYSRTADQPDSLQQRMMSDHESEYDWYRDGYPVIDAIADAAGIPEEAAGEVQSILCERHADMDAAQMGDETEFDSGSHYEEKGPDAYKWHVAWREFEHSLKTRARFFSQSAALHLAEVFGGIDLLQTRAGHPLVVAAGPGTALERLFRCRVFQSVEALPDALRNPESHLGPPPRKYARAGRMNAQGISVFYGATDEKVAIAEVRPPVGSRLVVASFSITRPLCLLDLTALDEVNLPGSIFDPSFKRRLERVAFLWTLGRRMARPVMPDDEAIDYLPTQAVADFLASMNQPRLDGIIFPSAQTKDGRNVVLFHDAARVHYPACVEDAEIEVNTGYMTEDGWEDDYSVLEEVTATAESTLPKPDEPFWTTLMDEPRTPPRWDEDHRDATLEVDRGSLKVHHVTWVDVNTVDFPVMHHRQIKQ